MEGSSTYTGISDASVFKRRHIKRRLDMFTEALCAIEDKQAVKFSVTAIEVIVYTLKNLPYASPVNPVFLMDHIASLVKEEYLSKRVPKSICGSSVISDQTIEEFADPRSVLQDITQASIVRAQCNSKPTQHLEYSSISRTGAPSYHQRATSIKSELGSQKSVLSASQQPLYTLTESIGNFRTEIARIRDEAAASKDNGGFTVIPKTRSQTVPKPTPTPAGKLNKVAKPPATATRRPANGCAKFTVPVSKNCNLDQGEKNISLLNGTATGISRYGRILKPPVKFWNFEVNLDQGEKNISLLNGTATGISRHGRILKPPVKFRNFKGDELSYGEPGESVLDEPMTLSNKKVIEKKKTPPIRRNKENTPNESSEKKNASTKEKTKKKTNTHSACSKKKNVLSIEKPKIKKEVTKQRKEKIVKEPAMNRKSKDTSNVTTKKKKIEDPVLSEEEDGCITYKKPTHPNLKLALSPTGALLSAKKAAGEAQGRATPPCKAIGDIMANESILSIRSAAKEAPKQSEAIKRVVKKIEKNQKKPTTQANVKHQVNKRTKENSQMNDIMDAAVKSLYSRTNSSGTLTVFRGEDKQQSDSSDMEQDDDEDDDDLM